MKHIVITGSTRGIGLGMARDFLERNCTVTITGRSQASVDEAVNELSQTFNPANLLGIACDVGDAEMVQALWDASVAQFGKVDVWINNAALSHPQQFVWDIDPSRITAIISANITGAINGCHVALRGMSQQGFGQIYNMEGSGSYGNPRPKLLIYQTTKRALRFLTVGLLREAKDLPVMICSLSPGIVITDLLMEGYEGAELQRVKRFFNILGDKVETVTPFLVEGILNNQKNGARIAWLTRAKIAKRFITAPFNRRDIFSGTGY